MNDSETRPEAERVTPVDLVLASGGIGLDELMARLPRLVRESRSAGTWRAYLSDFAHFRSWCASEGFPALPAAPATVIAYLEANLWLFKLSTLRRRLAAISVAHDLAGYYSPTRTAEVRSAWSGVRRNHAGTKERRMAAIDTPTLRKMVEPLGGSTMDLRDRALLVMGFAGALRRSELSGLDATDITADDDGLRVIIQVSKTDQDGDGRVIGLPYGSHRSTCPVRSWRAWADASGITAGPAFRSMTKGGKSIKPRRLSGESIAEVIQRRGAAVGLDVTTIAGHSLRAGFITTASRAGVPEHSIMQQSGHTSSASLRRYIREGSLFSDNPASKVGL